MTPIDGQSRKFGTGHDRAGYPAGAGGGPAEGGFDLSRSRRTYGDRPSGEGTRDRDAVARSHVLKAVVWGGAPGLVFGLVVAVDMAGRVSGVWVVPAFLLGLLGVPVLVVGFALLATAGAGRAAGTLHFPGGRMGPPRRPYSMAEALALQGRPEQAAAMYELFVGEHPREPEAYLRLARLSRDALDRPEEAARWFRLARERCALGEGQERLVARELVELYRGRLGDPVRAAPELARLAERLGDTPEGARAREELADAKRLIAEREGRDGGGGRG